MISRGGAADAGAARVGSGRIVHDARHGNPLLEAGTGAAGHELLVALRRARAATAPDGARVLQVLQLLQTLTLARGACEPLSVADHAARHGMAPAALHTAALPPAALRTAVRRGAGRSPKDCPPGVRLGRAKELPAVTGLPVAAVARHVAHDDPPAPLACSPAVPAPRPCASAGSGTAPSPRPERSGPRPRPPTDDRTAAQRPRHAVGLAPMTTSNTDNTGAVASDVRAELARLRESIDNIDAAVVHMVAERFKCTQQVGHLKAAHQLPPADPSREAQQIARLRRLAENANLDPAFAEKLLNFIIAEVIRHHERIAEDAGPRQ
ncbi:monofunctional chorismate mutase [Streptomyces sp. V3I8]|nr:monofunctional chorismate mutase [Streptomyces sp. V3I8]